jgi:outer membrane receptor protein involved in Fe transport
LVLHPVENSGSFFNDQHRRARTIQLTEALTVQRQSWGGDHVFKVGLDFLYASYKGTSLSRPVEVRRTDGTLSQRIDYGAPTIQDVDSTDIGVFAQDRWRVSDRLLFELGARIDRNGVLEGLNVAPRAGMVLSVLPDGSGVLRGGAGVFFPETTLNVKAFESHESPTVRWFAADGMSEQETIRFTHRLAAEKTPSSLI